jgi:O-antigen ligase
MERIKQVVVSQQTYVLLIAGLLLCIPLPYAFSSVAVIVLSAVSFVSLFFHSKGNVSGYWIPAALYGLALLSLLWSVDTGKSLRGLERQLPLLIVPLSFWMMPVLTTKSIHRILKLFASGLSVYGLFFIGVSAYRYFFEGWKPGVFSYHALVDYFDLNAIYVSVMVSLSLLYMLFYAQRKTTDRLTIALLAIFLLLLASKNVLAVTTLAFFLGALLYGKLTRRKALLIALAAAFLTAAMFYGPIKKRWNAELNTDLAEVFTCDSFGIFYPWTGTTIRLFQARMFYELVQENNIFLTGFGINAAQEKVAEAQNQYDVYCGYNTYNFHNQYLQVFAELGVFGLLILLLLLAFIFKGYLKTRELIYLFFFLITASVFLSETYIWRQRGLIHFLVLYGLLIKLAASNGGIKRQQ